jgi:hypothetical protein
MKTCGTCRHFGPLYKISEDDLSNTRLHECQLLKHLNVPPSEEEHALFSNEAAGVVDGSGFHAAFCVSEEFGCNQHAEKP